ncbi:MAG: CoA pyrophosphatase [Chloroflexi bacterium]|nr:CoA pyrophosphatase [Chloroflexota bacterium]
MTLNDVRRALALARPGRRAQVRLSPRPRVGDRFPLPPEIKPKEAGVLILLFPHNDDLHFFLTRRTNTVETHKGQIALPGGAQEPGETLEQTAVRETSEELGIAFAHIEILGGALTPLWVPISGFRITPFVAFTPARPDVSASQHEVVEVIDTPLELIVDAQNIVEEPWTIRDIEVTVPFFLINGHKVWGATAMMLSEFGEMLREAGRMKDEG